MTIMSTMDKKYVTSLLRESISEWEKTLDGHWHKTSCKKDHISISDVASGLHTCFERRISRTLNTAL